MITRYLCEICSGWDDYDVEYRMPAGWSMLSLTQEPKHGATVRDDATQLLVICFDCAEWIKEAIAARRPKQ